MILIINVYFEVSIQSLQILHQRSISLTNQITLQFSIIMLNTRDTNNDFKRFSVQN